jgi:ABC-2 type transport system ATP-binding protein
MHLVDVQNIKRSFNSFQALDGVSFSVQKGEIFGLLGPNGAGKTTTVRIMTGVLRPDSGRVLITGQEISPAASDIRRMVGVVPQQITVYEELTALDNLVFWGKLYGLSGSTLRERIRDLLELVGLDTRAKDRVSTYSGGMKRRLNLCMGLIHEPQLLVLDEPTLGIDPQARLLLLERVREIAEAGTGVVYTTHYLEEAESICNRIAIIDHGRVLALGTLRDLLTQIKHRDLIRVSGHFNPEVDRERFSKINNVILKTVEQELAVFEVSTGSTTTDAMGVILQMIPRSNSISVEKPTLQSLFIQLTGRELRDQ